MSRHMPSNHSMERSLSRVLSATSGHTKQQSAPVTYARTASGYEAAPSSTVLCP